MMKKKTSRITGMGSGILLLIDGFHEADQSPISSSTFTDINGKMPLSRRPYLKNTPGTIGGNYKQITMCEITNHKLQTARAYSFVSFVASWLKL
jgi:hypothetical protein